MCLKFVKFRDDDGEKRLRNNIKSVIKREKKIKLFATFLSRELLFLVPFHCLLPARSDSFFIVVVAAAVAGLTQIPSYSFSLTRWSTFSVR